MSDANINSSAHIAAGAQIGRDVVIGPFCKVGENVKIGDNCVLTSHVNVVGHTTIGPRTTIQPFASLGTPPQSTGYRGEPTKLVIGADNDIREHVTMNTGTAADRGITQVGDGCMFMVNSHVAHDCTVGDKVIFANNAVLGGHVTVGDNVVFGGGVAVRQFVRIGEGAMLVGLSGIRADIIPYGMAHGPLANHIGLNVVGMRRRGLSKADIHRVRDAYQTLFFGAGEFRARVEQVAADFAGEALIMKIVDFIRAGKRPLTMAIKRGGTDDDA
jgi:UDP-N-acetylglucosamine acyltransferase